MENLKLVRLREFDDSSLSVGLSCFTIDSFRNAIYAVTKSNQILSIDQKSKQVVVLTEIINDSVKDSFALHVELFIEADALNIYFDNGSIISYSMQTDGITSVGFVEEGIAAVASSPDQEYISLISKQDKLFLFTRFFDVLVEKDLHTNHAELIQKVDVGWGSKQTQFHGSEGKKAAKMTAEPLEPPVAWDDQKKRIFWRGDGLYFVTSAINPEKNHRVLRIWNNEGLLQYESEYVAGLEHSLTWRPEGNLITSSRYFNDKHEIVFFEKNGLRHGEFSLPSQPFSFIIKHLIWSSNSKVLLIHGHDDRQKEDIIYLYSMRNYHWYLKQCYKFSDDVQLITWDPSSQLILTLVTSNGSMKQFSFDWKIDRLDDLVAVIDGCKVQMTPFKQVNIPPPMSAFSIVFDKPVNELSLYRRTGLLIYNCDGELLICEPNESEKSSSKIKVEKNVRHNAPIPDSFEVLYRFSELGELIYHIFPIDYSSALAVRKIAGRDELIMLELEDEEIVVLYTFESEDLVLKFKEAFKSFGEASKDYKTEQISLANFQISGSLTSEYLINLSRGGSLYVGDKLFMENNCTSFLIHKKFLLTTGTDNLLRCHLLDSFFVENVLQTGIDCRDEPRNIERGSKLVASVEDDARVILQMPRGNLESIHPMPMLLNLLQYLLSVEEFDRAFRIMRRHRINLNLLVDHSMPNFLSRIEKFILEIGKDDVQNLCLFLSELTNERVTETMYKFAYMFTESETMDSLQYNSGSYDSSMPMVDPFDKKQKISKLTRVCSKMRKSMMEMDQDRYLIPILVSFVKEDPPKIDKALMMIHQQADDKVRDDALRYLFYLSDIDSLYKEALGSYNFDIFFMVAEKTNKDPKEYHAYIKQLSTYTNVYYLRYKIDVDLKRYDKALEDMNKLTSDTYREECVTFIKNNRLYWSAINILQPYHPWIEVIWEAFGDYLLIKRYYEEAGLAYQKAKSTLNAIKAYQLSENWRVALQLALSLDSYDFKSLCRAFVNRLIESRKYLDAAYILEIHLNDDFAAVKTLTKGHHWAEANRLIESRIDTQPYSACLESGLIEASSELKSSIRDVKEELDEKINRLKVVEDSKIKALENEAVNEEDDLISDTASLSDSSSISSSNSSSKKSKGDANSLATRQSRHKNKKNLKKFALKKGSANEDIALRQSIKETIDSCRTEDGGNSLIRWLFYYGKYELANECYNQVNSLIDYVNMQIKLIWPDEELNVQSFTQGRLVKDKRLQSLVDRFTRDPASFVPPKLIPKSPKFALIQE